MRVAEPGSAGGIASGSASDALMRPRRTSIARANANSQLDAEVRSLALVTTMPSSRNMGRLPWCRARARCAGRSGSAAARG